MQFTEEAESVLRPAYRAGSRPRAVRVYTINQESRYIVIENVPALGLTEELISLISTYGDIEAYRHLDDYPSEEYTDTYWIKFSTVEVAKYVKQRLDDRIFFHKPLRIRYGPEYESVEDTRQKLLWRMRCVRNYLASPLDQPRSLFTSKGKDKRPLDENNVESLDTYYQHDETYSTVSSEIVTSTYDPMNEVSAAIRVRIQRASTVNATQDGLSGSVNEKNGQSSAGKTKRRRRI